MSTVKRFVSHFAFQRPSWSLGMPCTFLNIVAHFRTNLKFQSLRVGDANGRVRDLVAVSPHLSADIVDRAQREGESLREPGSGELNPQPLRYLHRQLLPPDRHRPGQGELDVVEAVRDRAVFDDVTRVYDVGARWWYRDGEFARLLIGNFRPENIARREKFQSRDERRR